MPDYLVTVEFYVLDADGETGVLDYVEEQLDKHLTDGGSLSIQVQEVNYGFKS